MRKSHFNDEILVLLGPIISYVLGETSPFDHCLILIITAGKFGIGVIVILSKSQGTMFSTVPLKLSPMKHFVFGYIRTSCWKF
jgi:hypothetical protein